ncbi:MAG: hypothetical protein KDB27_02165 [Planctomycetales bacterium]|nr:hypothetical protein [Planctomycetales bacterium]
MRLIRLFFGISISISVIGILAWVLLDFRIRQSDANALDRHHRELDQAFHDALNAQKRARLMSQRWLRLMAKTQKYETAARSELVSARKTALFLVESNEENCSPSVHLRHKWQRCGKSYDELADRH